MSTHTHRNALVSALVLIGALTFATSATAQTQIAFEDFENAQLPTGWLFWENDADGGYTFLDPDGGGSVWLTLVRETAGQGDVTSAAAVTMMQKLAGEANFTEMFSMDFGGNSALMMHMGEGNWKLARKDRPVRLVKSTLSIADLKVPPVMLGFSLEPGDVTLVSLTTLANGQFKLIVTEGQALDFPPIPSISRPHYKFSPNADLCDFLTRFSMEGGSHHQALAYGRLADVIEKIGELLGIECSVVKASP